MPPTKKAKNSPPDKVAVLLENIRLKAKAVREPVKTGKPGPASSKTVNQTKPAQDVSPADNPYAREIFFCKTNVREIALQTVREQKNYTDPAQIEAAAKDFRYRLFRTYVEKPHFRIREPLHKLRFESEYYEYRLHLALAMGMQGEENYQDFKERLDAAGLDECWVNMRKDNLLLVHEDKVLRTVQAKFVHWGAKLAKLSEYMLQAQRNYEAKQQAAAAAAALALPPEPELDPLLDALKNRSNAPERLVDIEDLYAFLAANPPRCVCYRSIRWLVFEDDALNRRFGLGTHAEELEDDLESESETMIGITALDNSSIEAESVHSENSEMAQMRAEMAMTQPEERGVPIGAGAPFYQNTAEMITALEPTQQVESFASVPIDPLLPPDDPMVPVIAASSVSPKGLPVPQDDPLGVTRLEDEIPQDEPMPQLPEPSVVTVTAVAPVPEGHLQSSGEEGSELSQLTPGQQEVISISDDDDDGHQHQPEADRSSTTFSDEIKLEEGFWESVENLKRYTNINEYVARCIRIMFKDNPQKFEQRMAKLDKYVRHFVSENVDLLRKNVLPDGIVKLTRRARRERDAVAGQTSVTLPAVPVPTPVAAPVATMPSPPAPNPVVTTMPTQSSPVASTLEPLFNGALPSESQFDTPRKPLPTKIRPIAYEDSPLSPPRDSLDLMPMPDSENFQPDVHSTQNTFGGPMISAAPGTPRPSPRKQPPTSPRRSPRQRRQQSVDSRSSTPGFAADNLNETVQKRSPQKQSSPRVKVERNHSSQQNHSGYEDEVQEVLVDEGPFELDDTPNESQINPMDLIERGFGVPPGMRNRMEGLFKNPDQPLDATQSQTPEKSGSAGERRLSLDRQSMGFRSQSPRVRSD